FLKLLPLMQRRLVFCTFLLITGVCLSHLVKGNSKVQDRLISGTISDETGSLVAGVSVALKGAAVSTMSGDGGVYQLTISGDYPILVFTHVSYEPMEIPVGQQDKIDVVLTLASTSLEEVVLVGYGAQKK